MIICEKHSPCTCLHTHGAKARGSRFGVKNKAFNLNCLGDPKQCQLFRNGRGLGSVVRGSRTAVDSPADGR